MPLASELVGSGFSPGQAAGAGGTANTALAATGSTQADAALIRAGSVIVTGADGTKGVVLPAGMVGDSVYLANSSASALKVYPPSGAAIWVPGTGAGSANASYSATANSVTEYKCVSATQWFVNKSA
jgi:hypothetical protein